MTHFLWRCVSNEIAWHISFRDLSVMRLHDTLPFETSLLWECMTHFLQRLVFYENAWHLSFRDLSVMRLYDTFPWVTCLSWDCTTHFVWKLVCYENTWHISFRDLPVMRLHYTFPLETWILYWYFITCLRHLSRIKSPAHNEQTSHGIHCKFCGSHYSSLHCL